MDCPKCGKELTMMLEACLSAPSSMYRKLSKINFRKKGVDISAIYWWSADYSCIYCNYQDRNEYSMAVMRMKDALQKIADLNGSGECGTIASKILEELK